MKMDEKAPYYFIIGSGDNYLVIGQGQPNIGSSILLKGTKDECEDFARLMNLSRELGDDLSILAWMVKAQRRNEELVKKVTG